MSKSPLAQIAGHERARREILVKSDLIPPLPDVVVRVLAMLNEEDTEPESLEEHLHYDPVLVAKMLGMVNSPFYGVAREITTIKDAVMVLGFRGLRSLLLASSTAKHLKQDYSCYGHGKDGLWRHSLAVAATAKALAEGTIGRAAADELFVAGLLHDIGKLLLASYLQDAKVERIDGSTDIAALERDKIGLDHAAAGGLVAAKWRLSSLVQEVLEGHHGPADPETLTKPAAIVRLADNAVHAMEIGYAIGMSPNSKPMDVELATIGMSAQDWIAHQEKIREETEAALEELDGVLS